MASDRVRFSDLPVGAEFSLGGWRGRKVGDGCVVCKPEYVSKHKPRVGGYYVRYEDGYESWSPAEAFEGGYTRAEP